MKYLFCMIIFLSFSAMAVTETDNPFGNNSTPVKKSVTKPKKAKYKKADNCSNLPTRCADIADCADAQRALRCGMTRLDRDHDGTACDAQCG